MSKPSANRAGPSGTTLGLIVAATVMLGLAGFKALSGGSLTQPPNAVPPEVSVSRPALFTDVTKASKLTFNHVNDAQGDYRLPEEMGPGAALLDYDDDGDLDIYVVQGGELYGTGDAVRNQLFRNDGHGRFEDVAVSAGVDIGGYGMGCAAGDIDSDGDVDLYVTRYGPDALLLNNGDGTFHDATAAAEIHNPALGTSLCFLDYDKDSQLDIYVANYVDCAPFREKQCYDPAGARDYCSPNEYEVSSPDKLFRNLGGGRFEDVSESAGITAAAGNGLGVICTDFNADGWVDVFVACDLTPGLMWVNNQDGTFSENAALSGVAFSVDGIAIAGMGTAAEDFDSDGDFDVVVTNLADMVHLGLRNDGGLFEDVSAAWGLTGWGVPLTGFGIAAFDQNHNGALDLFVSNGAVARLGVAHFEGHGYAEPNQFARWQDGAFVDATAEAGPALKQPGISRGAAKGDIDNDGDVDIVVTNNRGPLRLLRNDNDSGLAWVMFDLVPKSGARHAINARLTIEAGGRRWHREVCPHVSYLCSHDHRVHVGLGQATQVDRLTVQWPSGLTESWTDLPINALQRIEESTGSTLGS